MRIIVVGGGVSGAHAALTLLERGHAVELWDVGRAESAFSHPGVTFHDLKMQLDDPVTHLLGADLRALIPPAADELLRYPPSRQFIASPDDPLLGYASDGFSPFGSFAKGGLANGWGANALGYDEHDLSEWPVSSLDLEQAYRTVSGRIPVAGPIDDDLTKYLHGVYPSQDPIRLSAADECMLRCYRRKRRALQKTGVLIGLARLAVVTDATSDGRCDHCDRCLWGCPRAAIYNPAHSTLARCEASNAFRYVAGRLVLSLLTAENRVSGIRYLDVSTNDIRQEACDVVFLAAGALQTGAIFLRTLADARADLAAESDGLMDTTVVKIPFVALRHLGQPPDARSFQFNRLIMGVIGAPPPWPPYLHAEILHLTSLVYHPLIERMPFDSRLSKRLFFTLKPALGVATLFFPDRVTPGNRQVLVQRGGRWPIIELRYRETADKEIYVRRSVSRVRSALWRLSCAPKGVVRSPPGAGIHYAGTVPMGGGPKRCDATGRSNLLSNLYIADGAAFPSLPSKSITLSLAAHATRVARGADL